jgi:ribonuclease R
VQVDQESTDASHQLIEECMLLANRAVAEWLEEKGLPCVYRLHAPPDAEKLTVFAKVMDAYGIDPVGVHDRFGLQALLRRLEKEPRSARLVLNFMCLRAFKKAVYGIENVGHYALAFRSYAHFTSPIRRYPDLLVHRLVKRALGLPDFKDVEIRKTHLDALAKQSSWLEQRAETAERTLHARKSARYLSARIGESFPGVVTGATGGGLFVQLLETGMEGMLPVRELTDDYYDFDPERLSLVGSRSGRVFGPGTEIDIRIAAVDIERSDVIFGMVAASAAPAKKPQGGESVVADLDRLLKREGGQPPSPAKRPAKDTAKEPARGGARDDGNRRKPDRRDKQERHEQKRGARKERRKGR